MKKPTRPAETTRSGGRKKPARKRSHSGEQSAPTAATTSHPNKDALGRFKTGNRANPTGRPRGSRNKTTLLVEQLLEDQAEKLTACLIKKAMGGSTHALELVFARLAPVRRDRPVEIRMPPITNLADLVVAHGAVI